MARQQHCRKRHREGAADSSRVTTIDENGLHLTLRGDSISGTVEVGGRQLQYADIVNRNLGKISIAEQRNGIEILRARSASMGRFRKIRTLPFRPRHRGQGRERCARAPDKCKKRFYHACRTQEIRHRVFVRRDREAQGESGHFPGFHQFHGFRPPSSAGHLDPRPILHATSFNDSTVAMALEMTPDAYWGIEYTLPKGENYLVRMRIVQKGRPRSYRATTATCAWTGSRTSSVRKKAGCSRNAIPGYTTSSPEDRWKTFPRPRTTPRSVRPKSDG